MMRRLLDDPVSPRTYYPTFRVLGLSGQIQGHHLSRERATKIVDRVFGWFTAMIVGLVIGWMVWG